MYSKFNVNDNDLKKVLTKHPLIAICEASAVPLLKFHDMIYNKHYNMFFHKYMESINTMQVY